MEVANPVEFDPASWILVEIQNPDNDNPFEFVESKESPAEDREGEEVEEQKPSSPTSSAPAAADSDRDDYVEYSMRLQKSVEIIHQSIESLQTESRSNSTEIERLRARLDKLLLKQKLPTGGFDISCKKCGMEIGRQADIVSRDFRGQSGPAVLIRRVSNVHCGPSFERTLMTGVHVTAWEFCKGCGHKLGWRYLGAMNPDQKYKIGMSCIETESVNQ